MADPPDAGCDAPVSKLCQALMLPRLLGFLDCRRVIPAAAAVGFDGRGGSLDIRLVISIAASAESRAAPGRELVDPGGPLIQARIHRRLLQGRLCRASKLRCFGALA